MAPAARSRPLDGDLLGRRDWEVPAWSARLRALSLAEHVGACVVLVVDNRSDRRTSWCNTADFLRFVGYTVCEAANETDAARLRAHLRFDVVVADEGPPDTGVLRVRDASGACTLLEKPVPPDELVLTVWRAAPRAG